MVAARVAAALVITRGFGDEWLRFIGYEAWVDGIMGNSRDCCGTSCGLKGRTPRPHTPRPRHRRQGQPDPARRLREILEDLVRDHFGRSDTNPVGRVCAWVRGYAPSQAM